MRYAADKKQQTRQQILSVAARQFRERGFDQASVSSIMGEAGLTHGGFYAHFKSKDQLVAEVIRGGFDQVTERFEERFSHLDGKDWLRQWVERYLSDNHLHAMDQGCPLPALAGEIARSGDQARQAFTELFEERIRRVMARVDAPEDEARRRVLAAVSQMAGALMLARSFDNELATDVRSAAAEEALATLVGEHSNTQQHTGGEER